MAQSRPASNGQDLNAGTCLATCAGRFVFGNEVTLILPIASPIEVNKALLMNTLLQYKIDDAPVFNLNDPKSESVLPLYAALADSVNLLQGRGGMENTKSLRARFQRRQIITDDNMGAEWSSVAPIFWH